MENECFDCGGPCEGDICDECTALQQHGFEPAEPSAGWYAEWRHYSEEYS